MERPSLPRTVMTGLPEVAAMIHLTAVPVMISSWGPTATTGLSEERVMITSLVVRDQIRQVTRVNSQTMLCHLQVTLLLSLIKRQGMGLIN